MTCSGTFVALRVAAWAFSRKVFHKERQSSFRAWILAELEFKASIVRLVMNEG